MMCPRVFNEQTVRATPRQLAELVGGPEQLVWLAREQDMDWCLCVIDVAATLDHAGLNWTCDSEPTIFHVE